MNPHFLLHVIAIAVLGIFVLSAFNHSLDIRLARLEIPSEVKQFLEGQRIKLAGAEIPAKLSGEEREALEHAVAESFMVGFRLVMLIAAGLALASALSAWLVIEGKGPD